MGSGERDSRRDRTERVVLALLQVVVGLVMYMGFIYLVMLAISLLLAFVTAGYVTVQLGRGWQVGLTFILLVLPMRCLDRRIDRRIEQITERLERGQ